MTKKMDTEKIQVSLVTPQKNFFTLRQQILRPNQSIDQCTYAEDFLPSTFHLAVTAKADPATILCIASFSQQNFLQFAESDQYRLRGMATLAEYRGQGLGALVLETGFTELRRRGVTRLWCNAREIAFQFYEKLGFQYEGPIFNIDDIGPHKVMFKKFD